MRDEVKKLKGRLGTNKSMKDKEPKGKIVNCTTDTYKSYKEESNRIVKENPKEQKIKLVSTGKEEVKQAKHQLGLTKYNATLNERTIKDKGKEIDWLRKEKEDLEKKQNKQTKIERKAKVDLKQKHKKKPSSEQKARGRRDLDRRCDRNVEVERRVTIVYILARGNDDLRIVALTSTSTVKAGNKRGLKFVEEMQHQSMYEVI